MDCTWIDWPNSLTKVPSGIANRCNLTFGERAHGARGCVFHGRKMRGVATNAYLRKTSKKPERCGLRTLSVKGSGVVFMHGEGISTPHVRHKGRQPLIECANMTLIFTFPLRSYIFYALFYIFLFLWSTRVFSLCSYVFLNCDEEIRPT